MSKETASVVVNNYNYARFLREAVDSALNQIYAPTEVIVVDDGSTDESREIIDGYGSRIVPLLRENGGQTAALNAAFAVSRGGVVIFLDSDDTLDPGTVTRVMEQFLDGKTSKVHWPLREIDTQSRPTGAIRCPLPAAGNLAQTVLDNGPDSYARPPTSGNAWSRAFLSRVLPLNELENHGIRIGSSSADSRLSTLAALYGNIGRLDEPHGSYRLHGSNGYQCLPFDLRLQYDETLFLQEARDLRHHCALLNLEAQPGRWRENNWSCRVSRAVEEICALVKPGEAFILADQDWWQTDEFIRGRRRLPYTERSGRYCGAPADDRHAISELDRLRAAGASYAIFAWPSFWWLDFYTGLRERLESHCRTPARNERIVAFDLSTW